MRVLILSTLALLAAACAPGPGAVGPEASGIGADDLNAVAEDYVRLILDVGEIEEGYVDAYYGPAEWQAEAKAETETPARATPTISIRMYNLALTVRVREKRFETMVTGGSLPRSVTPLSDAAVATISVSYNYLELYG